MASSTKSTMEIANSVDPSDLFSAKGLVIVITGGGTGKSSLRLPSPQSIR